MASHEGVLIEFDQSRRLFFDFKAAKALDRSMGEIGLVKVLELLQALNISTLERTLWAGLQHEDAMLTVNAVSKRLERYIDAGGSIEPLFRAAVQAVNDSKMFKPQDDDPGNETRKTETA